jgi:hypothetical protein
MTWRIASWKVLFSLVRVISRKDVSPAIKACGIASQIGGVLKNSESQKIMMQFSS